MTFDSHRHSETKHNENSCINHNSHFLRQEDSSMSARVPNWVLSWAGSNTASATTGLKDGVLTSPTTLLQTRGTLPRVTFRALWCLVLTRRNRQCVVYHGQYCCPSPLWSAPHWHPHSSPSLQLVLLRGALPDLWWPAQQCPPSWWMFLGSVSMQIVTFLLEYCIYLFRLRSSLKPHVFINIGQNYYYYYYYFLSDYSFSNFLLQKSTLDYFFLSYLQYPYYPGKIKS